MIGIDSMDEGAQEEDQFEMEIDNEETGGSECSSVSENSEEDDECWKCGRHPNRVQWVSGTLVQGQQAKAEVCKMRNQQGIQKSSLVETESDTKRNELEALALLRRRVKEMRASGEMDAQHDADAAQHSPRNRLKRSHETSSPLSVNFETRESNAATSKI